MNMRTDYKTSNLSIWRYNHLEGIYQMERGIPWKDVLDYNFTARDFNSSDEFNVTLKNKSEYRKYVPNSEREFAQMYPMIIVKMVKGKVTWFSFITHRAMLLTNASNEYIKFSGSDFTSFNEFKLVGSNLNFKNVGEELPDDFAMYKKKDTFDNHLRYMYYNYVIPRFLTYGRLAEKRSPIRKFKGLNQITVSYDNNTQQEIQFEQQSIKTALEQVCTEYNYEPVTRQVLDLNTGYFNVFVSKPQILNRNLVQKLTDIIEQFQDQRISANYIFAYGWGNNCVNVYRDDRSYFTSMETMINLSETGKQNNKYITTVSKTRLETMTKNRITYALKIMSDNLFTDINCGDVIFYNNSYYKISTIKESDSLTSGQTFDVELKLTDENGITIKDPESVEIENL